MTSKAAMLERVKGFRWRDVRAGLESDPDLLAFRDPKGRNWLHVACGVNPMKRELKPADSVKTARVLLDAGLDINREAFREHQWKATPLWYAIARGENLTLARALLKAGANPNYCLWAAAFRDDVDAIRLLARSGAVIDDPASPKTPFLEAVRWSRFCAAEALLKLGANVDFQDEKGMTALHYMLKKGSGRKHIRMVIRYGARGDLKNAAGITAAELLLRKRDAEYKALGKRLAEAP
jgi:ankyrin repeat protein